MMKLGVLLGLVKLERCAVELEMQLKALQITGSIIQPPQSDMQKGKDFCQGIKSLS